MPQDRVRTQQVEELLSALTTLETNDEVYNVLRDLCTVREIEDMALRLSIACRLAKGDSYASIESETGVSSTTVARVSRALNYGYDGYRTLVERISSTPSEDSQPPAQAPAQASSQDQQ